MSRSLGTKKCQIKQLPVTVLSSEAQLKTKPKQIRMQFRKQLRITIIQMIIK